MCKTLKKSYFINLIILFSFYLKQDLMDQQEDDYLFTILHFNDVYDIQPNKKGKNGIVSFQSYVSRMKKKYPKNLLLFSGDCFSPSILTHIYQGRHMVKALNTLGIDVACYGNHQFDLQQNLTVELAESCNFPWLLGNIRYKNSQFLMGNGKPYIIKQVFNMRIGIFGVAGQDWLGILKQYLEKVDYEDVGQFSKKITKYLKQQQKCDMIIALTHMRTYQDQKLPHQAPLIDISLGGHDHIIMNQFINQIPVIKSGDNFKTLGIIHVSKKSKNYTNYQYKGRNFNFSVSIKQIPNPSPKQINQQLKNHVDKCMAKYLKSDHLIGYTDVPLQIRFAQVRTKETNYGNFLTDLVRLYYDVDCCIMNAGCIRIDGIIPAGQLRYSVISNIINNPMIVKQISGETLLRTLQFAVSGLPGFPGNFLCVSGIRYTFDINKTPRVQQVFINNQPLIEDRKYMMSVNMYIGKGGDGFSMLKQCKTIIDQIAAIDLLRLILKFFKGKNKQKGYKTIKDVVKQKREHKPKNQDESQSQQQTLSPYQLKLYRRVSTKTSRMQTFKKKYIIPHGHSDLKYICITPKIDGRIRSL